MKIRSGQVCWFILDQVRLGCCDLGQSGLIEEENIDVVIISESNKKTAKESQLFINQKNGVAIKMCNKNIKVINSGSGKERKYMD